MQPNRRMSQVRRGLGLTLRDVVSQSTRIAADRRNRRFQVSLRKLSEMEKHSRPPSIHQACTLALLYGVPISEVLSWYLGPVVEQASTGALQSGASRERK
jgi:hypothetical protein